MPLLILTRLLMTSLAKASDARERYQLIKQHKVWPKDMPENLKLLLAVAAYKRKDNKAEYDKLALAFIDTIATELHLHLSSQEQLASQTSLNKLFSYKYNNKSDPIEQFLIYYGIYAGVPATKRASWLLANLYSYDTVINNYENVNPIAKQRSDADKYLVRNRLILKNNPYSISSTGQLYRHGPSNKLKLKQFTEYLVQLASYDPDINKLYLLLRKRQES